MALVRKKNPEWFPSENKALQVGETVEITDFRRLVESGMAEYVDAFGTVLPLPGTIFVCGICFAEIDSHEQYVDHIMTSHGASASNLKAEVKEEEPEPEVEKEDPNKIEVPESFGKRMAEARKAAKAKREAVKPK